MKILQIHNRYHIAGGADRYFFELNRLLESQGEEVIPFSVKNRLNSYTPFEPSFLNYIDLFGRKRPTDYPKILTRVLYSFEAKNRIKTLIEKTRPQVAHVHIIHHGISSSVLPVIRECGIPAVHTVHNFDLICPSYSLFSNGRICQACKGGLYLRAALRRCHKGSFWTSSLLALKACLYKLTKSYENNIDLFIAPSRFLKALLIEYGFDKDRLVYMPHFIDAGKYSPWYTDSGYFVYFGRLDDAKGLPTLLEAMKKVRDIKLYIVGSGPSRETLERSAEGAGLSNVKFLKPCGDEALKDIIKNAMFTVAPSESYETFGLSIIESFAMGKPVIGSDLGAIPEIIDDGVNGLLFEPGNVEALAEKIQYFIDHPGLCLDMGHNARRKAEVRYNPRDHYEKLKNLYSSLLSAYDGRVAVPLSSGG